MLRKLAMAVAVTSLLALPTPSFAFHGGGGHGGGHGGFHGGFHGGHGGFHGGGFHGGRGFRGGRGHFWHGRWWGYGIGPCWQLTPIGYIWICG